MSRDIAIQRLRRTAFLALGFITLVVIAAQGIVSRAPTDSAVDVRIVNLAGRQRTLSQRITKCCLMIHEGSIASKARAREDLDTALGEFARAQHALRHGDPELGLPENDAPEVVAAFGDVDRFFRDITAAGEALLSEPAGSTNARQLLATLVAAEREFLPRMELIIAELEDQTLARVRNFRDLETLILVVTFISLVAIAVWVIRPTIRSVEEEMQLRQAAEDRLRSQAEDLREAARVAEAAVEAKARFLASMSHEMRTPLNGIIGMAQVMEDSDLDTAQRKDLEVIQSSSHALLSLISDILDLAKIESGRLEYESIDFDLRDLTEQTLRITEPGAVSKGIETRLTIDSEVPQRLNGDPTRIRQVLLNLLSNAVKFTEAGGVLLRVEQKGCDREGRCALRFEVVDTGVGIAADQRDRVFRAFTQADESTTRRFGGTGLGLAISRQLVEGMGGVLDFDSEPGQGTTFHFTLQLGKSLEAEGEGVPVVPGSETVAPALSILLVDDLQVNRLVARRMLEKMGHRVEEAEDGLEAVAAVETHDYDVVLMDLQMPRLDGIGATSKIRAIEGDRARTPIVALTADALAGDRERILASGLDDYLSKPLARARLTEVLARISARSSRPPVAVS